MGLLGCGGPFVLQRDKIVGKEAIQKATTSSKILWLMCYNRQGRKAKDRRSRDHTNRGNTGIQTIRSTGTYNQPLHLTPATIVTSDLSTLDFIGDLSRWRHLTARSPCQEVSTTTIHGSLTLDQRHAEFPMCSSQKGNFSHCWPDGCSHLAKSVQITGDTVARMWGSWCLRLRAPV